jgi:hypothetical protein
MSPRQRKPILSETREQSDPRVLFWDIETMPHITANWGKYDQNAVWVESYGYTFSMAWNWLGETETHVLGLDDFPGYRKNPHYDGHLIDQAWLLLDEADIVIAHNGINFDTRKVMGRIAVHDYERGPSPFKEIDTKLVAKRAGFFFSNSLNDLADELNIGRKVQTGGAELWKSIFQRQDKESIAHMKVYNIHDVELLKKVYLRLRKFDRKHPNLALMADRPDACPKCLRVGTLIVRKYIYANVTARVQYSCNACGSYSSGREILKSDIKYV